jgi:autoinducer 2 (AI-2) kinase
VSGPHLLAIDAGTGSCRAALFDTAGRQVAVAQREWSHPPIPEHPGSQRFDTATNWQLIGRCIRDVVAGSEAEPSSIAAVSATSMREGIVLYDEDGRELWACPNADSRAAAESKQLIDSGAAQRIYDIAGDWVAITSPPRLLWLQAHEPEIVARAAHLTMLSDWVIHRLTGEFVTDPSVGASSGMFDLATRSWSADIIAMCGFDPAVFPDVVEPGTPVGAVSHRAATETGLAEGTPVVIGGADTQLALVGLGRNPPGTLAVVGGTFWQHTVVVEGPLIDPQGRLRTLCHAVPGQWMVEGIGFLCGLTMRWFRDAFCHREVDEARHRGVDPYVVMEERAATVPPGSNGVIGVFSNVMNARRWVHASPSFLQFDLTSPSTSGAKECIRAIEECAAYVTRAHVTIIDELLGSATDELIFTGGASAGSLWPQIVADVTGARVHVSKVKESSALGCALFAGVGAGVFPTLDDALDHAGGVERTCVPEPGARGVYDRLFDSWRDTYARSLELVEHGVLQPLWRPPGA